MSESESIKAEISFHEKMFFAAIAILVTLVGWMASNYLTANGLVLVFVLFGIVGASAYVIYQYRLIKRLIQELKHV